MLLFPTELTLTNVGPYAGTHKLDLVDDVYAVVAKHIDNPERSNWIGKSTLLWCFPYALFGEHPAKNDNEWITHGEAYAELTLKLSDGSVIRRTKPRDKTAQLSFRPAGGQELLQGPAQDAIAKHIGLSKDEFMTVCFYAQKELSRLVSSSSADRIAIVEAWIAQELDPVQRLHARAISDFAACLKDIEAGQSAVASIQATVQAMRQRYGWSDGTDVIASLDNALANAEGNTRIVQAKLKQARDKRIAAETWAAKVEVAEEFDAVAAKGQELRAKYDAIPAGLEAELERKRTIRDDLFTAAVKANADFNAAKQAGAKFDGVCPVNCAQCPSAEWVRANPLPAKLVDERRLTYDRLADELNAKGEECRTLEAKVRDRTILEAKLDELREQAAALVDTANEVAEATNPPDLDALDDEVAKWEQEVQVLERNLMQLRQDKATLTKADNDFKQVLNREATLRKRRVMLGEALQLLGKTGLQQRLGEIALAHVEVGANAMLASAGIQLTVQVLWAVHNQGLAKHCDKCGTAYATSARVKQCTRCGAPRGPNTTAKLVIDLSNRSGAAEDLAGIAVGLAASVWLRNKRSASWGSVCIDEPFGALDQHNKRALSVHVSTLLKQSFSSAFIVAHDREILDALPQRVTIVGTDKGSILETA